MRNKIVSLKNNEDFKNMLKGHKLSNKYFVMFYKKLLKKNPNKLNISIVTQKKKNLEMPYNAIFVKDALKILLMK